LESGETVETESFPNHPNFRGLTKNLIRKGLGLVAVLKVAGKDLFPIQNPNGHTINLTRSAPALKVDLKGVQEDLSQKVKEHSLAIQEIQDHLKNLIRHAQIPKADLKGVLEDHHPHKVKGLSPATQKIRDHIKNPTQSGQTLNEDLKEVQNPERLAAAKDHSLPLQHGDHTRNLIRINPGTTLASALHLEVIPNPIKPRLIPQHLQQVREVPAALIRHPEKE